MGIGDVKGFNVKEHSLTLLSIGGKGPDDAASSINDARMGGSHTGGI